jgi:hypothetical protein
MQPTLKVILDHFRFVFDYFGDVQPCTLTLHAPTFHARPGALSNALLKFQIHSPVRLSY